ncbi:hypothetical protein ACWC24_02340, partial [Streptomyces sp. NPDC001443]
MRLSRKQQTATAIVSVVIAGGLVTVGSPATAAPAPSSAQTQVEKTVCKWNQQHTKRVCRLVAGNTQGGTQGGGTGNTQGGTQGGGRGNTQGGTQGGGNGNTQGGTQGGGNGNTQGGTQGGGNGNT